MLWKKSVGWGWGSVHTHGRYHHDTDQQLHDRARRRVDGVQVIIKHATISHVRGCDCDDGGHSYEGGQEEAGQGDNKVKENETPKFKRWISGTGPPSRNTSEMELLVFYGHVKGHEEKNWLRYCVKQSIQQHRTDADARGGAIIKSPKIFFCPFGFLSIGIPRGIFQ